MVKIVDISLDSSLKDTKCQTLADDVFMQLRTAIVKGDIASGSKINEPQLANSYGISRGPLREAIRRLEGCKLVEIRPNAGARVVSLNKSQVLEIYEIRESLEGLACRLAADRSTPESCTALRELLARQEQQMQSASWQQSYQHEGDVDFHYLIVRLSENQRLFELLCGELYYLLKLCRARTSAQPSRHERAFREHYQIVDAIEGKDGELAELLMRRHIANARSTLLSQHQPQNGDISQEQL
ncbi:MAG: GntR family transcriptional regulator [Gammaproteobacteria bacterium]|nr:GntR family transcriptional regulator [Gammaproteobacteria bacterium]MCY4358294.1 GntR family transcriptional regulator [Gammaproteobacteria bacterium]